MSRGTYTRIANRIRQSTFILPLFLFILAGLAIGTVRMGFDYYTNWLGVMNMGLKEFEPPIVHIFNLLTVATMPQILTVVCFYIFLAMEPVNKTEKYIRWTTLGIWVIAMVIDIYLGYLYYGKPGGGGHPLLMAGVVDTLFSEVAFTVCFGLVLELRGDAVREFRKILVGDTTPKPRVQSQGHNKQQSLLNQDKIG